MTAEKLTPKARPFAQVMKTAMLAGVGAALAGVLEGFAVGCVVIRSPLLDANVLVLAADRGLLFGLLGVALGALGGILGLALRGRRAAPAKVHG